MKRINTIDLYVDGNDPSTGVVLSVGGDDFITKPFDMQVLVAKVQAILRRSYDFSVPT